MYNTLSPGEDIYEGLLLTTVPLYISEEVLIAAH